MGKDTHEIVEPILKSEMGTNMQKVVAAIRKAGYPQEGSLWLSRTFYNDLRMGAVDPGEAVPLGAGQTHVSTVFRDMPIVVREGYNVIITNKGTFLIEGF